MDNVFIIWTSFDMFPLDENNFGNFDMLYVVLIMFLNECMAKQSKL